VKGLFIRCRRNLSVVLAASVFVVVRLLPTNLLNMDDFETRAKQFDFASDEAIRTALEQPGTIVLDVRTQEEIAKDGSLKDQTRFPDLTYQQSDCTAEDCEKLRVSPEDVIPNITASTATIVMHCRSGRRVTRAKALLLEHGYQGPILNAGGYTDIQRFF
jgi:rhodanese-related sulfurtransferase